MSRPCCACVRLAGFHGVVPAVGYRQRYAQGTALFIRARNKSGDEAERLARRAASRFEKALQLCRTDAATLANYVRNRRRLCWAVPCRPDSRTVGV